MLFFRSEEHIDRWCRTWKVARGGILNLEQGWRLALAWYGPDRRDAAWRWKNVAEVEALFADIGLTSGFWSLRLPESS